MSDSSLRERVLSSCTIYDGAIITVEKWRVSLPNGREADREIVLHKGASAIVPVDANGQVTLVRQQRIAIGQIMLEIPAGKLDFAGEDPLLCAKRELEEETGLRAGNWQKLTHAVTTPGFCSEQISLYLATELTQAQAHADEDEFVQVVTMPLTEAVSRVMKGEITDAKTCLGLLMAHQIFQQTVSVPREDVKPRTLRPGTFPKANG